MNFLLLTIIFSIIGFTATGENNTQFVRILDVLIYGPVLLYVAYKGLKKESVPDIMYYLVIFMGATTITYNGKRYIKNRN